MPEDPALRSRRAVDPPRLAIVVPCFDEEETIRSTTSILRDRLDGLGARGLIRAWSILLVDDGSRDATWDRIVEVSTTERRVRGIRLAANVGHQAALLAGMRDAVEQHEAIVTIDADLQDDVDAIEQMVVRHRDGADVVLGVRDDRGSDTLFKRGTARAFYSLSGALGVPLVMNHADFRLLSREAANRLLEFPERNLFLRALVSRIGGRTAQVDYARLPRELGTTKYPFRRMLSFAVDGITSFSVTPLRIVTTLGIFGLFATVIAVIYVVAGDLRGETVQGWTSTLIAIALMGSFQMLGIGLLGEYVARIYLEVKGRPRYQIESRTDG